MPGNRKGEKMGMESIEGVYTIREWISAQLDKTRIVKQRTKGNTAYLAYRSKDNTDVYGIVIDFIKRTSEGKTIELIGRIMDENMGPYKYRCPRGILQLLTPTKNRYALKWRAVNWAGHGVYVDWISMLSDDDRKKLTFEREEERLRDDHDPDLIISAVDDGDAVRVITANNEAHWTTKESYDRIRSQYGRQESHLLLHLCVEIITRQVTPHD